MTGNGPDGISACEGRWPAEFVIGAAPDADQPGISKIVMLLGLDERE
jgi:hypothetical protein